MNMLRRELSINLRGMLIWTTAIAALGILVMAFFPTVAKEAKTLEQLMTSLPKGILSAFGLEQISMSDILGYYATKHYVSVALLGSIYAIMLSSGMLSKEEHERTIEFLLSKPVGRSQVITAKMVAALILLVVFNLLLSIIMYITLEIIKTQDFDSHIFLIMSVAPLLLHLTFAAIGFLLSVFISRNKSILPLTLGIVLVTYFLGIIARLTEKLDFLKYFSPFRYVDAVDIITQSGLSATYLLIMAAIIVVCVLLTYVIYNKKDIVI